MIREIRRFLDALLRGYGQFFLANNPISGACIFLGLLLLSPVDAGWSLLGASIAAAIARRARAAGDFEAGLFGVNGALISTLR